jgi:glucuronoarabinoxylan endo-1,4-beta-xylanase
MRILNCTKQRKFLSKFGDLHHGLSVSGLGLTVILVLFTALSSSAQVQLIGWSFTAMGGQSSVATTTVATGISTSSPSAVASLASGLTAINYLSNGLTGREQSQTTLAAAITGNEYISFSITPASGKSVSITSIRFRPVSQNRARSFSLFSSRNGFASGNVISTISANGNNNAALQTINISGHTNITTATEFRVYIYGYTDVWESVGFGNRQTGLSENDLIIMGTVQDVSGSNLTVSPTSLSPGSAAGSSNVTVTSNVSWTATDNQSWITVSPASGTNNGTVSVSVTANTGSGSRSGTVTISGGSIIRTVSVTQSGVANNLTVSPSSLNPGSVAGSSNVSVTSNVSWTAIDNQSWITVSPASGTNNGTVSVSVTANTGASRSGTVTIAGGSITRTVSVTQAAGNQPAADATLTLNANTQYQTMDGFGFFGGRDVWWNSNDPSYFYNTAWLDRVIGDLGVSIWRNELFPHNPPTSNTTANQDAYWDKQRPLAQALKSKADDYGVDLKIILTVWSPPGAFKWWSQFSWVGDAAAQRGPSGDGDYWSEKNGGTLNPNKYTNYANWLIQGIQMYKDAGLDVYAISPQNEPGFSQTFNSCTYTTFWYKDMINAVAPAVKAAHPGIKIFGSENMLELEGASNNYPYFFTTAIKNNATATSNIDILAYHGYSDGVNASSGANLALYWANTVQQFAQPMGKKQWMTETSGYVDTWETSASKPGAFNLAMDIYSALYYGNVSGWVWWQGSETTSTTGEFALFSNTIGKKYYASKNFYRYIRPDAVRVASTSSNSDVLVLAFKNSRINTTTVVVLNSSTSSKTVNLSTVGSGWPSNYDMFVSSATQNCVSTGNVSSTSTITIPARSVVTLQSGGTATLFSVAPAPAADNIKVYPNPSASEVKLSFTSEEEEEISIELRDNMKQTRMTHRQSLQKGENEIQLDISKLPSGIYIMSIQRGSEKTVKRIFKP